MQSLRDFIISEARSALSLQKKNGSMPAGHNGPYYHPERPLRNSCHWLITWSHTYKWTGEKAFLAAAENALTYILSSEHRPHQSNWWQRSTKGRDRCNGTIGAAWVIEALACATSVLHSNDAWQAATQVFDLHSFDTDIGLWRKLEIDGTTLPFDKNFNHQLWFAAASARLGLAGHHNAKQRVETFMENLESVFSTYPSGLIRHRIHLAWWDSFLEPELPLHSVYVRFDQIRRRSKMRLNGQQRDIGYHAFNLYAFAVLHTFLPEHAFWNSTTFRKALAYSATQEHKRGVERNPYAYPYNPVGFEMARVMQEFLPESVAERQNWIHRQISALTAEGNQKYGFNAEDSDTARARLYEAVEIENTDL